MKFDLISDFHVEFNVAFNTTRLWEGGDPIHYAWHNDRKSDILVMAGDSANSHEFARDVIVEASKFYKHVLFVDGNHEHYSNIVNKRTVLRDMEWFNGQFTHRNKIVDNVTYLDGENIFKIDKTLFIGVNGWYNFTFARGNTFKEQWRAWQNNNNDSTCIRFGKKNKPHLLAMRQMNLLKNLVREAQDDDTVDEIVVVTHTLPTETAFGQFGNPSHPFFPLNGSFGNELMCGVWLADDAKKIKVWCFGHTHEQRDFFENDIHFMCNPRGYRSEKKWHGLGFDGIKQIDTEEIAIRSAFGEVEE